MSTTAMSRSEKRKVQISALLTGPDNLTDIQVAKIVGCSTKSVQRTRNSIKPVLSEIEDKLEEYRTLLHKHLPLEKRAKRLGQLAMQDTQMMVALKAIERADAVDGLV